VSAAVRIDALVVPDTIFVRAEEGAEEGSDPGQTPLIEHRNSVTGQRGLTRV
jgi:hypothetical protein